MAKRTVVGSVVKAREANQSDYIKINTDITLKKGDSLRLESKKDQLAQIAASESAGKIDSAFAAKLRERAEKIPDFVRFEIVKLEKTSTTN